MPAAKSVPPNNDWGSTAYDHTHIPKCAALSCYATPHTAALHAMGIIQACSIFAVGWDVKLGKRASFNTYYSLAASKGNVNSFPLGDPTLTSGPDKFLLDGDECGGELSGNHQPESRTLSHLQIQADQEPEAEVRISLHA